MGRFGKGVRTGRSSWLMSRPIKAKFRRSEMQGVMICAGSKLRMQGVGFVLLYMFGACKYKSSVRGGDRWVSTWDTWTTKERSGVQEDNQIPKIEKETEGADQSFEEVGRSPRISSEVRWKGTRVRRSGLRFKGLEWGRPDKTPRLKPPSSWILSLGIRETPVWVHNIPTQLERTLVCIQVERT